MTAYSSAGSGVANAAGRADVWVRGPHRVGTTWELGQAVLSAEADPAADSCEARLYRGFELPTQLVGTSVVADADTMEGLPGDQLAPGDQLLVVFTGLVPGSTARVNIRGRELAYTN